ncbi:MAG TPA: glycolate oxidase subunit GlcE [Steroidobacteraceae bacterium]|nr:glycolate oxidase subunit GlcE [Steroidobacteraceae bacterium]
MTTFAPRTADEATEALRWALAAGEAFEIVGSQSKRTLGRPVNVANVLDVSGLSGIVSYEPAELVLTARAGTPLHVIEAALAEHGQCLAFEPPDFRRLLAADVPGATAEDAQAASGTLGGVVATGLSGPRRFKVGAVRDHLLGIAAVSGRAEAFVAGGKVVKNVTGYDIPKLMAGSYGTLAVLTEITMKVLPAPEDVRTLIVAGLDVPAAVDAMTRVLQSALDVSGACHLPAEIALAGKPADVVATAFRLEGFAVSVEFRAKELAARLGSLGAVTVLRDAECAAFWRDVRDVAPFAESADWVWRLSVPPAAAPALVARIQREFPTAKWFLDWAGGLVWLAVSPNGGSAGDSSAPRGVTDSVAQIRGLLGDGGGHATLFRAPARVRAVAEVFQPQPLALAALSQRVKSQFDPRGILNPGRMYADV